MNVNDIRKKFKEQYEKQQFFYPKGSKTVEIINASFEADEQFIFGNPNEDYLNRETSWYLSQSLNVNDIPDECPKIWKQVATSDGFINSNYGYLVYNECNFLQFDSVLKTLKQDKDSRRAIMIYTRPSIQKEYNINGMSDFICTNTVQYFIRKNKLITCVNVRSNDAWAGYRNDKHWQDYVRSNLHFELLKIYPNLKIGKMFWNAGSLHLYENQFYLLKHYIETNETSITKKEFDLRYIV